ncbi:hypothetical protein [Campylobacter sp. RM16187]|uniref:hypothetical protein n=1 Tax=Campylobacter sp. RM16187 TaxID=1660063 RepID=UPI0021B52997|nr:hypothetical protein [Campylobacter sp. RM16187]QKG30329.1 hypothetical protein CDOMF_b031 [Campylobacter sp. RM16187]
MEGYVNFNFNILETKKEVIIAFHNLIQTYKDDIMTGEIKKYPISLNDSCFIEKDKKTKQKKQTRSDS